MADELAAAKDYARFLLERDGKCVIKPDGLTSGKGVRVVATVAEADDYLDTLFGVKHGA